MYLSGDQVTALFLFFNELIFVSCVYNIIYYVGTAVASRVFNGFLTINWYSCPTRVLMAHTIYTDLRNNIIMHMI